MRVVVEFTWVDIGVLSLDDNRNLIFPKPPNLPGIYRFHIGDKVYIGQTDRLPRRFQHYRTPGISQATNIRLKARIIDQLSEGVIIQVDVITEAFAETVGDLCLLDLSKKHARLLVESAALTSTLLGGGLVENH